MTCYFLGLFLVSGLLANFTLFSGYVIKITKSKSTYQVITISEIRVFQNGQPIPSVDFETAMSSTEWSLPSCFDGYHATYCQSSVHITEDDGALTYFSNDTDPWIWIDTKQPFDKLVIYNYKTRYWIVGTEITVYKDRLAEIKGAAMFTTEISTINLLYEFDVAWYVKESLRLRSVCEMMQANGDVSVGSKLHRKAAVVTEGAGFVGRHFVARLCSDRDSLWTIIVVDNLSAKGSLHPQKWPPHLRRCGHVSQVDLDMIAIEGFNTPSTPSGDQISSELIFIQSDCRDFFSNQKWLDLHFQVDLFIHLAAVVGGRQKIEAEPFNIAEDLVIDTAAFLWASKMIPSHMIYFSSSAAYPITLQNSNSALWALEMDEEFINIKDLQPIGVPDLAYGWSKLTGEFLIEQLRALYGSKLPFIDLLVDTEKIKTTAILSLLF